MRLQYYLNDEYSGRFKGRWGDSTEIFVNPSKSEIRDASKNGIVRFFAYNKTKKFYVWNPEVLHGEVVKDHIDISGWNGNMEDDYFLKGLTLQGTAKIIGGKLQFYDSDVIDFHIGKTMEFSDFLEMLQSKWKWVNKWMGFDYIKKHGIKGDWIS